MASSEDASPNPFASAPDPALYPPARPDTLGSLMSTVAGPARLPDEEDRDGLATPALERAALARAGGQRRAAGMPHNPIKQAEHGWEAAHHPQQGPHAGWPEPVEVSAGTLTENTASDKLGDGQPQLGLNPNNGSLDRVRVDSQRRTLTTNQGVPVADNQNSLKAGLRGPVLLEDFILREKITQFDHERIPERVVHARGSGAYGVFEAYQDLADLTCADLFGQAGRKTPVFVRFSTVAGERGSADTVRDVRGFAVKFYTRQGNWDLVGNNIPVFFIQDAMKFPDLIHAVKPEPHNGMPQAASAHDTFWDFASLMPESAHMLLWVMSDRGIPRSYRTMQGFGVHTFRLVDAAGDSRFVKFHWLPLAGTHSLVWDEAAKITGADADYHRRDLWEAIESGHFPEYELALQVFTEEEAERFSFDVLDATKLIPEELVPLRVVGKMTLNRNPDNFFAETEQVAFCTAHVVPGIDFSNDPLLAGRIHSYIDTQISRLGGPNFHEIPVNAPLAQVHNNQRDGQHRQAVHRGRVAYEPNSLGGGCPHQAGMAGFITAAAKLAPQPGVASSSQDKVRGKPEKFADHFSQAQLFWRSQTAAEKRHIVAAFRFELSRVTVPAVRERVVSMLVNVDAQLALGVAHGLGIEVPPAQAMALQTPVRSEVEASPGLSLFARPGTQQAVGRRVALLVTQGVEGAPLRALYAALVQHRAVPRFVGLRLGRVVCSDGPPIDVEASIEAMPSVLWDAVALPGGDAALALLAQSPEAVDFVKEQYRHSKPVFAQSDAAAQWLADMGIPTWLGDERPDPGVVLHDSAKADGPDADSPNAFAPFMVALSRHRHHERELELPRI
jgi:catalase